LKTQLEVACEPYNTLLHAEQQEHGKTSTHWVKTGFSNSPWAWEKTTRNSKFSTP